jgi:predicted nucleic acid-binding protein
LIVIDTSIWVDHFSTGVGGLETLVSFGQVLNHPFVTGELAVGDPRDWGRFGRLLRALPVAQIASETEFLDFVASENLAAKGLGFVDVHLLASCRLRPGTRLWSRDKRLARFADALGFGWNG